MTLDGFSLNGFLDKTRRTNGINVLSPSETHYQQRWEHNRAVRRPSQSPAPSGVETTEIEMAFLSAKGFKGENFAAGFILS